MRVLVITNMYPPHHLGGYELSCQDVVQRWRAEGHEVTVLTSDLRLADVTEPDSDGVRRNLRFYWSDHEILRPPVRTSVLMERHNHAALDAAIEDAQPDVVSIWHMGAMSLSLLTAVARRTLPMVFVVCDDWPVYGPLVDAWTRRFRSRPRLGRIAQTLLHVPTVVDLSATESAFCFVSDFIRTRAETKGGWRIDRSAVVYSGIDHRDFPVVEPGPKDWRWRLLYAGRVEERKGVHLTIRALSMLPAQARLVIAGPLDPGYHAQLTALASELGVADRVRFIRTTRHELRGQYANADVLVFPVVWDEPFGLVPVEAMATGTPVVGTATGGSAEFLVHEGNALVVPPGDAEAIAAAVRRLAQDAALRARLQHAGAVTARLLSVDRYAADVEAWHRAAAERFAAGTPPPREPIRAALTSSGVGPAP